MHWNTLNYFYWNFPLPCLLSCTHALHLLVYVTCYAIIIALVQTTISQKAFKRLQLILGCLNTSNKEVWGSFPLTSLQERGKFHILIAFRKLFLYEPCSYFLKAFVPALSTDVSSYSYPLEFNSQLPSCRTQFFNNSFFQKDAALWNSLHKSSKRLFSGSSV